VVAVVALGVTWYAARLDRGGQGAGAGAVDAV